MQRRRFLKTGLGLGLAAGLGGTARFLFLPPGPSSPLASVNELAVRLYEGLSDEVRQGACVAYQHPLRQVHNRGVGGGGLAVGPRHFSWEQRGLLTDLFHSGLSQAGRERIPRQFFLRWPGVQLTKLLFCGDPRNPPYQLILTGPHLNLRLGGTSEEGVVFGGPQVYGDQRGNGRRGLPGSRYRYQLALAEELIDKLSPGEREEIVCPQAPPQTDIQLRGAGASFDGLPVGGFSKPARQAAERLVAGILATYAPHEVAEARAALEANGGVDALSFATYEEADEGPSYPHQIFRLEGPAAVFFYRGYPHLHAFLHLAHDANSPLKSGTFLGNNPKELVGGAVQRLFEAALRSGTEADLAYYDLASVAGRLLPGPITTGDIWCLESWENRAAVLAVRGRDLVTSLTRRLADDGRDLHPERLYSVATTSWIARHEARDRIGLVEQEQVGPLVRDLTIRYLDRVGFEQLG